MRKWLLVMMAVLTLSGFSLFTQEAPSTPTTESKPVPTVPAAEPVPANPEAKPKIDRGIELYNEYQFKKCDGIFAIDMRNYKGTKFNLQTFILTKEGLNDLYRHTLLKNRQIYIFIESTPMIAIVSGIFNEKYDPHATP